MDNSSLLFAVIPLVFMCCDVATSTESNPVNWTPYGEAFEYVSEPLAAHDADRLMSDSGEAKGVFDAEIVQSCMTMGCWMSVKGPGGDTVLVFMKDHAFFVPKDSLQGKRALFAGEAFYDTLSVALQKHLLEDAGADQATIDAVIKPAFELAFEASGVRIADVPPGAPMAGEED